MLDGRFGVFHAFVDDDEHSTSPSSSTISAAAGRRSASRTSRTRRATSCTARWVPPSPCSTTWRSSRSTRSTVIVPRDARPGDPRAGGREAPSPDDLRGQVQPPVLDRRDARPRPRRPHDLHGRGAAATRTSSSSRRTSGTRGAASRRIRAPFPGRSGFGRRTVARSRPSWPTNRERPENPLSDAQVRQKFRDNASLALDAAAVASVESAISSLERASDLRAVLARLSPREDAPRSADGLETEQREIVATVREFVERTSSRSPPSSSTPTSTRRSSSRR